MINSYFSLFLASVFIASISQIILKISAKLQHGNMLREYFNKYVVFGYLLMFISSLLTTIAYRCIPLSYGPIINSLGYLLVGLLSRIILKEKITKRKILGYLIIILGVLITNL